MKLLPALFCVFVLTGCELENRHNKEAQVFKSTQRYVIFFSPMEGRLFKNGHPLPNAKIIRKLRWNGNEEGMITEHRSDEDGHFRLPVYEEELELHMLDQFAAKAELDVEVDGELVELWYNNKFVPELHAETDGPLAGLVCDVEQREVAIKADHSTIMTRCRWDNMPDDRVYTD